MKIFRSSRIIRIALLGGALAIAVDAAERKRETGAPPAEKPREKIDINAADAATLQSLPGVTPELARAIIAARPFKTLSDLDRVRGLSPEQLEQLRQEVAIRESAPFEKHRLGEPSLEPTGRPPRAPAAPKK